MHAACVYVCESTHANADTTLYHWIMLYYAVAAKQLHMWMF